MIDYTPTTDQVRRFWQYASNAWVAGHANDNDVGPLGESHGAVFDRWLADHDRKIAAEALRTEAFSGLYGAFAQSRLLDRADRIEQGGQE